MDDEGIVVGLHLLDELSLPQIKPNRVVFALLTIVVFALLTIVVFALLTIVVFALLTIVVFAQLNQVRSGDQN